MATASSESSSRTPSAALAAALRGSPRARHRRPRSGPNSRSRAPSARPGAGAARDRAPRSGRRRRPRAGRRPDRAAPPNAADRLRRSHNPRAPSRSSSRSASGTDAFSSIVPSSSLIPAALPCPANDGVDQSGLCRTANWQSRMQEARPRPETECVAADAIGSHVPLPDSRPRHVLFTMSNSAAFVPAARCCTRVLCRLSRFSIVGWVERQRHPSPALAGTGFDGFRARRSTHPTNSYLSVFCPGTFAPGFSFAFPSFSASDPRARGWRSAGRRYPLSCRARNNATPRLQKRGPSRATGRRLAALHRDGFGPAPRSAPSCLRLACAGDPCCRHRFRSSKGPEPPGNGFTSRSQDATSRSAFRNRF